ncbi:hypothetical protein PIB30_065877 [Stylosanthes scabra]|uniref:Uncharacterized protein n=1 Tax=Stylosanthes scabra TaxID=79078 RepID=A0ABU6UL02_9FABA|nr:hypothetical protein [Stylosanthes scabra]
MAKHIRLLGNYPGKLAPVQSKRLDKLIRPSNRWTAEWACDDPRMLFQVTRSNKTLAVDLAKHTRSCNGWQLTVPSEEYWASTNYLKTEPPIIKRPIGRPKMHSKKKDHAKVLIEASVGRRDTTSRLARELQPTLTGNPRQEETRNELQQENLWLKSKSHSLLHLLRYDSFFRVAPNLGGSQATQDPPTTPHTINQNVNEVPLTTKKKFRVSKVRRVARVRREMGDWDESILDV